MGQNNQNMPKWVFNMSGLTCHRNATHLPLNDHNPPCPSLVQLPPPDDMDFDVVPMPMIGMVVVQVLCMMDKTIQDPSK